MNSKFEATFEKNNISRDGMCVLEFKSPAADLGKVANVLSQISKEISLKAVVIEDRNIKFLVKSCMFDRLSVFKEGNSRIRFEAELIDVGNFKNISEVINKNLEIEIINIGGNDDEE